MLWVLADLARVNAIRAEERILNIQELEQLLDIAHAAVNEQLTRVRTRIPRLPPDVIACIATCTFKHARVPAQVEQIAALSGDMRTFQGVFRATYSFTYPTYSRRVRSLKRHKQELISTVYQELAATPSVVGREAVLMYVTYAPEITFPRNYVMNSTGSCNIVCIVEDNTRPFNVAIGELVCARSVCITRCVQTKYHRHHSPYSAKGAICICLNDKLHPMWWVQPTPRHIYSVESLKC